MDWKEIEGGGDPNAETWDKKTPNPLEGKLTGRKSDVGKYKSKVYNVKAEDKSYDVWGSTVLDGKLEQVPDGSLVRIKYLGKQKEGTPQEYHDFSVAVANPAKEETPSKGEPEEPEELI